MSTTGVLVSGRHRRGGSAASLVRFASVAWAPQSYRNLLYLALALPLARTLLRIVIHPPIEGGIGLDWRQRVQLWLRDPVTWKSLVYLLAKLPMGIVAFSAIVVLGLTSLLILLAPVLVLF